MKRKQKNINLLNLSILIICEKIEGMPGNIGCGIRLWLDKED